MIDVVRIQRCRSMSTGCFQVSFFVIWDLRWEEKCTTPPGNWTKKLQGGRPQTNPSKTKPVSFPVGIVEICVVVLLPLVYSQKKHFILKNFWSQKRAPIVWNLCTRKKDNSRNHAKKPGLFHFLCFVPCLEFWSCLQ